VVPVVDNFAEELLVGYFKYVLHCIVVDVLYAIYSKYIMNKHSV